MILNLIIYVHTYKIYGNNRSNPTNLNNLTKVSPNLQNKLEGNMVKRVINFINAKNLTNQYNS